MSKCRILVVDDDPLILAALELMPRTGTSRDRRFNGQFKIAHIDNAVVELAHLSNASTASLPGGIVLLT